MTRIIIIAILFCISSLFAQITIQGKVVETKNNPSELNVDFGSIKIKEKEENVVKVQKKIIARKID
ncbi:hypothetical protein [Flavobacterium sp. JAS]|uniref:hypothetical protein n=1 Tax=Flavobacterium sp. JAS TaxID=2897329 RepID=UPI001E4FBD18|nr:hypothetical protein [Flavobacterium sp. JAS]MCD0470740.1 hypothetical protein [Flavobacterium sp. JAS]